MDFGKVDPSLINTIDFMLPPDGMFTQLLPGTRVAQPNVYVGGPVWTAEAWKGDLYPADAKPKELLSHYVKHFNSIELNATYYKIYPESSIRKWAEKAHGKDFLFCPKISQIISHYGDLSSQKAKDDTDRFLEGIIAFGEHLGPVFLQLSERFSPQRGLQLLHYLGQWPKDVPLFVEVRHPVWYEDNSNREWLFGNLHNLGIGTVITDTSGRRDCAHMEVTVPATMIRFVGNGKHATDFTRLDAWVERLGNWIDHGLENVYFFMHQPEERFAPELCAYFIEKMNTRCGLSLASPYDIGGQQSLF